MTHDFKFKGSFSAFLYDMESLKNEEDTTFGNRPTKSVIPEDYVETVYKAYKYTANTIDLNKVSHLHWVFAMVCGTQFLCRGSSVRTN
jgi:hypothetical protein